MQRREEKTSIDSILIRILDVILFLAERGLALRGDEERLGSSHNGTFLGLLEVLAKYDSVLEEHLKRMQNSQGDKKSLKKKEKN